MTLQGPVEDNTCKFKGDAYIRAAGHTQFHKQPDRRRTSRPTIRPEDDIVLVRVAPTFEEVEEQMSGFDVYVASKGPEMQVQHLEAQMSSKATTLPHRPVAEIGLFDAHVVLRESRMSKGRKV